MGSERDDRDAGARPAADPFFDSLEEERQRALAGGIGNDHAQRPAGQVQSCDLCVRTKDRTDVGVEDLTWPSHGDGHRCASMSAGPSVVRRPSSDATSAVNAASASDPSATVAEFLQVLAAGGGAERGRDRVLQSWEAHAARRYAGGRRDPDGGDDGEPPAWGAPVLVRAATTGSRRWGNLLEPSAPTCAHLWPRAGLANRRRASSANATGSSAAGNSAASRVSSTRSRTKRAMVEIGHGAGDGVVAGQQAGVRRGGMRAVEEPELAPLVGGHVIDEPDADVAQWSQPGD